MWFKVLLLIVFAAGVVFSVAQSGGWNPKLYNWSHAVAAVAWTLLAIGTYVYLDT